jgi:hypothetical protein
MSLTAILKQRFLTVEILQFSALRSFLSSEYLATEHSQFPSAGLGSSLYRSGADPTENTTPSSPSVIAMDGCVAIARISLTCLPAITKRQPLSRLFRGLCLAAGLYATITRFVNPLQEHVRVSSQTHPVAKMNNFCYEFSVQTYISRRFESWTPTVWSYFWFFSVQYL